MSTADDHRNMVTDCAKRERRLNPWEQGFIKSLRIQLSRGVPLTANQGERLDPIWERVSPFPPDPDAGAQPSLFGDANDG